MPENQTHLEELRTAENVFAEIKLKELRQSCDNLSADLNVAHEKLRVEEQTNNSLREIVQAREQTLRRIERLLNGHDHSGSESESIHNIISEIFQRIEFRY